MVQKLNFQKLYLVTFKLTHKSRPNRNNINMDMHPDLEAM